MNARVKKLAKSRPAFGAESNITGFVRRGNLNPRQELWMNRYHPSRHSSVIWYQFGLADGARAKCPRDFRVSPYWRPAGEIQYRDMTRSIDSRLWDPKNKRWLREFHQETGIACYRAGFWEGVRLHPEEWPVKPKADYYPPSSGGSLWPKGHPKGMTKKQRGVA